MLSHKFIKLGFIIGVASAALATDTKPMRVNSFMSTRGTKVLVEYDTKLTQTTSNKPNSYETIEPLKLKVFGPQVKKGSNIRADLMNHIRSEGTCNFPVVENHIAQSIQLTQDKEGFFVGQFPPTLLHSWAYCNFAHSYRLELRLIVDGHVESDKDSNQVDFILKIDAPQP